MTFLFQTFFSFFLVSFVKSQAGLSNNLYACMLFCSDGKRFISPICFEYQDECHLSLSSQAGNCPDIKNLDIFAIPFPSMDNIACSAFIRDLLMKSQNDASLQTKEQIGEASCGCTDMVSSFLQSVTAKSIADSDYCASIVSAFLVKFQLTQFKCGETKTGSNGLIGKFCSFVLDKTANAFSVSSLQTLCGFIFETIKKLSQTAYSLKSVYDQIQTNSDLFLDKTSNQVCGMLLCSSTTAGGVCEPEKYSNGIVAKLALTTFKTYCSVTNSVDNPLAGSSDKVYGCMVFCSDGKRIISSSCYKTEVECVGTLAAPISTQGKECSDFKNMLIYFFIFSKANSNSCSSFISNFLMSSQNDASLQTKEQIGQASCGCTDMVYSFLQSITSDALKKPDVCSAIVGYFVGKFKIDKFICGTSILPGLLGKFCSVIIDRTVGTFVEDSLMTLCQFILDVITKVTGLDLNSFYQKIANKADSFLNKTTSSVCGMMLCSSTSAEGCTEEKHSSGVIPTIVSTAVGVYCFNERLFYLFSIPFIGFITLLFS